MTPTSYPFGPHPGEPLTPQQWQIAHEVARGMVNKEIAGHLGVSLGALKMKIRDIFVKVGATTRIGMLDRLGWIRDSETLAPVAYSADVHASRPRDPSDPADEGPE